VRYRPLQVALLCFFLGLLATGWVSSQQAHQNQTVIDRRFERLTAETVQEIRDRLQRMEYGLRGMRGVVAAEGDLPTLAQIRRYAKTRNTEQEFPGSRGFGLVWRVAADQESAFINRMQAAGRPDFKFKQLAPHTGERAPIVFSEPELPNQQAVGLDINSEARRSQAAKTSLESGRATITAPISLVQASGQKKRGFLVLLPIYPDSGGNTPESAVGWSYTPIIIDEVLASIDTASRQVWLSLDDKNDPEDAFYSTAGSRPADASLPHTVLPVEVFGRTWEARLFATPAFVAGMPLTSPSLLGAIGVLLSMLLSSVSFLLTQRRQRAQFVQQERSRRAAIVESTEDAVVALTLDGTVTEWNGGAERLFGYGAAEAMGQPITALVLPSDRVGEDEAIRQKILAGERVEPHEALRRHKDGSLFDVSVSATPIKSSQGECIGLAKIFRDIRTAKQLQRHLEEANAALETQVGERTQALTRALHDLRNVIDALPSMIGYWDRDLRNVMANKAYADWFGVDPRSLKGRAIADLLGTDLFERNLPFAEAALRGEPQSFSRSTPRPDGQGVRHSLAHYLPDIVDGEVRGFYVLVHDVTELQEQRVALETERRDKAALLSALDAHSIVSMTDRTGTIISVNDRFCEISGYAREDLIGQNHRLINSGTHSREFWIGMWQRIAAGDVWHGEVCNRAKNGSLYWVDSVIMPFFSEDGRIDKIVSLRTDITEVKRLQQVAAEARQQAERSERFLREVTDRLPLSLTYLDADRRIRFVNASACARLGVAREVLLDQPIAGLAPWVPPEALPELNTLAARPGSYELQLGDKDRPSGHFGYLIAEDRDQAGVVRGYFAIGTDISDRKRAEHNLRHTLALLESVLKSATQVSIIAVDRNGRVALFNRGAERLLGYTADEVIGTGNAFQWHEPSELEARAKALSERLDRRVPAGLALVVPEVLGESFDCHYVRKDGRRVPVTLSVTEIRDAEGASLGFIGVAYDISARLQHEKELTHAAAAARAASDAKSHFLANMSHEIRTPLNAVIGLAHLLERTPLNIEQAPYVQNIKLAGNALLGIVNDVLDLTKIEAGEMAIEHVAFSLKDLCSSLQAVLSSSAEAKGLSLHLTPNADLPDGLLGDPTRLRQILTNLLGNAIKFTEQGSVELRLQVVAQHDSVYWLRFEVVDTGMGIAEDVLPMLFTPFAQADASTTRRFGGTGLGLSITRQLAELMGGEVGVHSKLSQGSCFWVKLPFELADVSHLRKDEPVPTGGPRLKGLRILLVDDSDINLQVAGRLLELEGAEVLQARNGAEAVDCVQRTNDLAVVLMDIQMPVMDGFEATRRIREMPERAALPVLALTAGNTDTEHRRARDAGVQDILPKPFDPERLVQGVRRALGLQTMAAAAPPPKVDLSWPQIPGIDAEQSYKRLMGDLELFRSMLTRMLSVCNEATATSPTSAEDYRSLAALMHNLKGSSSTLGATEVALHAAKIEEACLRCDAEVVFPGVARLRDLAEGLRRAAEQQLGVQVRTEEPAPVTPLHDAELGPLRQLLEMNDLRALDAYKAMVGGLRSVMSAQASEQLDQQMADLNFEGALGLLKDVRGV
jgi:PAS domain S-box-containing protein